jgi:hypothetical protein
MQKPHDNSKVCPAAFVQDSTVIAVIEMGLSSWLVAGMIPRVNRGVSRSVVDLQVAINRFVAKTDANPKPFIWPPTQRVLAGIKPRKQTLESLHRWSRSRRMVARLECIALLGGSPRERALRLARRRQEYLQ